MGSLMLPSSGPVYADALIFIYSVEKHPIYALTLRPLWEAVARGDLEVLSSELTLMETLIGPLKQGDAALETDYENFFASPGIRLLPITSSILRAGARLRATLNSLRTPDAIQAATGHSCSCSLFLTNDLIFRRIPGLPVVLLDDVLRS
ncbi:MAG: PIN domain-containing protein [Isosphaeraceae bacterium]|jgi:predicted nucleic acid-binding protein